MTCYDVQVVDVSPPSIYLPAQKRRFPLMAAMNPPKNLDEAIDLLSSVITSICGDFPDKDPQSPSSHISGAAATALDRYNSILGIRALGYTNYTDDFVESLKKTPLSYSLGCDDSVGRLEIPCRFIITQAYEDNLNEDQDGEKYIPWRST